MNEHRYTLDSLDKGTRHFKFAEPIEIVKTVTDDGNLFECRELGVAVGEGAIGAAWIAAYDKLMATDDEHLSIPSLELKRKLAANVTETQDGPPLNRPTEEVPTDKSKLKRYLVEAGQMWEEGSTLIAYVDTLPEAVEKVEAALPRKVGAYDWADVHDLQEAVDFYCEFNYDLKRLVWSQHDADFAEPETENEEA